MDDFLPLAELAMIAVGLAALLALAYAPARNSR